METTILLGFLFIVLGLVLHYKYNEYKNIYTKVFSVGLFLIYLTRLFSFDTINQTFNLLLFDVVTPINSESTWIFSPELSLIILFQRWIGVVLIAWIFTSILYPLKRLQTLIGYFGLILSVLYIIFFNEHVIAFQNSLDFSSRVVEFMFEICFLLIVSLSYLLNSFKFKISLKETWITVLVIIGSMFALMPQTLLINLFGNLGEIPKEFNVEHLILILIPIIAMFVIYKLMKLKSVDAKEALILFLAVASIFQYFYMRREDLAALPFHLCNMAVILIFFAVVFKIKSFFYFAYFANVIGAIGGILLPNYEVDFFTLQVIHFAYNHIYALIIPILGVALGVFHKPTLKSMYQALIVFTVYYLVILFLNAWFNNYTLVDYFFAYSDFLTDMLDLRQLQYNYVIEFTYQDLTFKFFWLYQLLYYLSFMGLMFASWYVYDWSYASIERNRQLRNKQQQMRYDKNLLIQMLGDKKIDERMYEAYKGMIKISNFSKRYGKSNRFAVKNFSLEVGPGEIFGFLGHNGAGKSTTIKSMVGIQSITEGEIMIDGYSIKTQPIEAKLRMGYVSDNHAVYEKLTGREYIYYVSELYKVDKNIRDERFNKLVKELNLEHAIDQEVKSYSHGMKQKLVVIASLIHEPPVWILDEPLTGLDPTSAYQIKESMKEHARKGNIVFFSSHVIEVVEKICTKIAVINQGELIGVYEVEDLKKKGISLETLYMQGK
ncbi:ABC-type transporter ATP-binding protein EcsA [Acholeplasma oculi]|nr:ATP-binding cassette domain-containing protein [Acholeplasma oculi]SKC43015.1 ABC-2 type transport system ATP-binding protein [Acholeplasma oculi]SUT88785.1 ABC-type transporter ATP-binding protein EcsA [Acholeplasma oculi]